MLTEVTDLEALLCEERVRAVREREREQERIQKARQIALLEKHLASREKRSWLREIGDYAI